MRLGAAVARLKEWLMNHWPRWLNPANPWGPKGRPHDPDLHALGNKQQELMLRLDRLGQRARRETEERRRYQDWDTQSRG